MRQAAGAGGGRRFSQTQKIPPSGQVVLVVPGEAGREQASVTSRPASPHWYPVLLSILQIISLEQVSKIPVYYPQILPWFLQLYKKVVDFALSMQSTPT